ncbi:hypothetical protein I79_025207 [Cricetulus griseus]|uniref:Uncharacterized protein n=1 Tax=Cricetulus griseus TaxID=10029 RepID=G3IMR2_CRIGR|nr:hypothetical protein I79_025207 [Cricetulus griseus]
MISKPLVTRRWMLGNFKGLHPPLQKARTARGKFNTSLAGQQEGKKKTPQDFFFKFLKVHIKN